MELEIQAKTDTGSTYLSIGVGDNRVGEATGETVGAPLVPTTEAVYSYGSSTTIWSDIRTGTQVANGNLFVIIWPPNAFPSVTIQVDYLRMRIYHSAPSGFIPFFI
jgi:hypothetical protein